MRIDTISQAELELSPGAVVAVTDASGELCRGRVTAARARGPYGDDGFAVNLTLNLNLQGGGNARVTWPNGSARPLFVGKFWGERYVSLERVS